MIGLPTCVTISYILAFTLIPDLTREHFLIPSASSLRTFCHRYLYPSAPIGPSPSYVYPAAAPYYPLLSSNMAAPSHLAPPSCYPLASSQYSTSSYYPHSSTSSSNINGANDLYVYCTSSSSASSLPTYIRPRCALYPLQETLREHHLRARWRHPMLPNPKLKLKLNLNLNLNLDLNTSLVILLTHHSYLSPPNDIIVFSVLETRPVRPQTCLLVRSRLKKILTVDAEIEGGRLPESWFEFTLDRSIDPKDISFWLRLYLAGPTSGLTSATHQ
ncbi:hypothetical protein DFH09DRAFT_1323357 [Mycena vulgaris]|nr:hypothetical protein DFH09DRAFT_1323357 [Mycena vulgaris]